jgi:hypothetical protein
MRTAMASFTATQPITTRTTNFRRPLNMSTPHPIKRVVALS